jgi:hypothetical protein
VNGPDRGPDVVWRKCVLTIRSILLILLLQTATDRSFSADETRKVGSMKALATYAPRPEYPYEARARGQIGAGVAIVTVDTNTGLVTKAEMATSTGYQLRTMPR